MSLLTTKINDAGGIYKRYGQKLKKLGIETFADFLFHIPSRYEDYSLISPIGNIQPGETVTIQGIVVTIKNTYLRSYKTLQKATVSDDSGTIEVTWFSQPFLTRAIKEGDMVSLAGKVDFFNKKVYTIFVLGF